MIPFFLGYALLVWWPCVVYRRRWQGYLAVVLGTLVLVCLIRLHAQAGVWTGGRIFVPVFQSLLIPYTFLIASVGLYINLLPRTHARGYCGRCGYDLTGLDPDKHTCPECGRAFEYAPPPRTDLADTPAAPPDPEKDDAAVRTRVRACAAESLLTRRSKPADRAR